MKLRVTEIFRSIQGESSFVGLPCAFVRLAGCNLRCRYCDTRYALEEGEEMRFDDIFKQISSYGCNLVEITGGEPLLQSEAPALSAGFVQKGHQVLVETNGTQDISVLPEGVIRIMDIKCPSSGESQQMMWENLWRLRADDEVKFVIANRHDYEWSREIVREKFGRPKVKILFSTVFGELPPGHLVDWILQDKLQVRFQMQIHKYIWPHDARGV